MTVQKAKDTKIRTPLILVGEHEDADATIILRDLTVKLPGVNGRALIKSVNLTLERGKRYVLTGMSGSGKTITTNAILDLWDPGSGVITKRNGLSIMGLPQSPYFPDTDLRGIMNMTPERDYAHSDKEIVTVLKKVGLDQLIQHLPGQQTEIMLEEIEKTLKKKSAEMLKDATSAMQLKAFKYSLLMVATAHIQENFSGTQYIPAEQKAEFIDRAANILGKYMPEDYARQFYADFLHEVDNELASNVVLAMSGTLKDRARRTNGFLWPLTERQKESMALSFKRSLNSRLIAYIENTDTDDKHRVPVINYEQAKSIANELAEGYEMRLKQENSFWLGRQFNTFVATPLSLTFKYAVAKPSAALYQKAIKPAYESNLERNAELSERNKVAGFAYSASYNMAKYTAKAGWLSAKFAFAVGKGIVKTGYAIGKAVTKPVFALAGVAVSPYTKSVTLLRAWKQSKELAQYLTVTMEGQKLRGSDITYGTRLSGGQKLKLGIAQALLHKPDVLVADEMTSGLDEETGEDVYETLLETLPSSTTVLSIAHNSYVQKYHTHHLRLENQTITESEIPEDKQYGFKGQAPKP